jgi:hypothetical protein
MSRLAPEDGNPKTVVSFGPSVDAVKTAVTSKQGNGPVRDLGPIQSAASYAQRIQARHQAADSVKGKGSPLGGAPPLEKEKMEFLASKLMPQPSFESEKDTEAPPSSEPIRKVMEPPLVTGVGSAYRVNQEMARGNLDRPVSIKGARDMEEEAKVPSTRRSLSTETLAGLEALNQAQKEASTPPTPKEALKQDSMEKDLEDATEKMVAPRPEFDFVGMANAQRHLVSAERRKRIEDSLEPMDIADMIVKSEIQQRVTIIPGKLSYTYRTYNQHENLFCLRFVYDYPGSVAYAEELLNTCKLVCSLVALNGAMLPDHRKGVGTDKEEVDKDLFNKKMFHVARFPVQMLADLSINGIWFSERATRLFSLENLKNG